MEKPITICFRTSEELRKALDKIAKEDRRTLSGVIEGILLDHVKKRGTWPVVTERRRHPRKQVSLPAFVSFAEAQDVHSGVIQDISLGGMRVSVLKETGLVIPKDKPQIQLDVLFALPQEKSPLKVQCKLSRLRPTNSETEVGVSFADCDFDFVDYERIQRYLLQ